MTELKTAFERLLEYYNDSQALTDVHKYHDAVDRFRESHGLKEPYSDFHSFRSSKNRHYREGKR